MSQISFDDLPDGARLWIFPADRPLAPAELESLTRSVEQSLAGWNAHGSPVRWGHTLLYDQVLLVGVDESHAELTGCSIDSCVASIRTLEAELQVGMLDHARVFYRDGDRLTWAARPEFRELAAAGSVTQETIVLNNIITTVGEFRRGGWETPAKSSWHAQAFPLGA